MGSTTADALGLSRAILCNDALVQRLNALQRTENLYRGLVSHAKATLHTFFDLTQIYKGKYIQFYHTREISNKIFSTMSKYLFLFQHSEILSRR